MRNKHTTLYIIGVIVLVTGVLIFAPPSALDAKVKQTATPTRTGTPRPTRTPIVLNTQTPTATRVPDTVTVEVPTVSPIPPTAVPPTINPPTQGAAILPFPSALLCPDSGSAHDVTLFHTIWDSERGCHYDHEHGTNPFTPEVAALFPGYNLRALLCNTEINHCNPSSGMENTHKHGGWKWDVMLANPHGCVAGFEGAAYCIKAAVLGYHAFGNYAVEMQARQHSAVYLLLVCNPANPSDCGTIFMGNLEDYGQRVVPYQTTVFYTVAQGCTVDNACPVNPAPAYAAASGPYNTIDCIFPGLPGCRTGIAQIINSNLNTASKWTSKLTGTGIRPPGNRLADLLFDVRDTYQVLDSRDLTYPFTFAWVCSPSNNGLTYNPVGCTHTNAATAVHEVNGFIPASLDNLAGFDTNPTIGRITTNSFVDEFGNPALECTVVGGSCYPIKMTNMFVGKYGDYLSLNKISILNKENTPSRNIFFCGLVVCKEGDAGSVPSGWFGPEN